MADNENPSRPASHDLPYEKDDLLYIDTYLGGECFSGEEAVWKDNVPIWSMNYIGRVTGEGFSGNFLKAALKKAPIEAPYRGPALYREGDYTYYCIVYGGFNWFWGYEEIFHGEDHVYECRFHGGKVK